MSTLPRRRRAANRTAATLVRVALAVTVTVVAWLALSATAGAHIDPDPAVVTAGEQVTVAFGVEHGCDDSDTTSMRFRVPDGVTDATGVAKDGWTIAQDATTITFTGNLDAHTEDHFELTFTVPAGVDSLAFPVVQGCASGEIAWIAVPAAGQAEPENPAPVLTVNPSTVSTAATTTTDAQGADTPSTTAGAGSSASTATSGATTASSPATSGSDGAGATSSSAATTGAADDGDDAGGVDLGSILFGVIGVALVTAGVVMILRRRNRST